MKGLVVILFFAHSYCARLSFKSKAMQMRGADVKEVGENNVIFTLHFMVGSLPLFSLLN